MLCNSANYYLKDLDKSEDVVQGVFVKFWGKRKDIQIEISLKAYLFQAVKNSCLNELKHEKVKAKYKDYVLYMEKEEDVEEQNLESADLEELIHQKIEALPEKRKVIFLLSRTEGLKYSEIAERLNISIKTVETQISLALKYLREQLKHLLFLLLLLIEVLI
jgi:RNA polymerase sigma-70 factor (ECF subfamily)